jgi:cyclopropane-fatty-acyl-phospholipid synthase
MKISEKLVKFVLNRACVTVGKSEFFDIVVHDSSFYRDVLTKCSLGLGDSFIERKWDSEKIDDIIFRILSSGIYQKIGVVYDLPRETQSRVLNLQDMERSKKVVNEHYDLPVDFYTAILDPYMQYSCAYFDNTNSLGQAQINKMELICEKLSLNENDRVLDIGGGWGGLADYMAERYKVKPVVVNLSKKQVDYIRNNYGGRVEAWACDYRDIPDRLTEQFDAVCSVGAFEHFGHKNYGTFMAIVNRSLKPGGRFLLHTLFTSHANPTQNPWVEKHIFPNSELPPKRSIRSSAQSYFKMVEGNQGFQDLSAHYEPTLISWSKNLKRSYENGDLPISDRMYRKFQYYFLSYAGAFRAQHLKVGQFLYQKHGA